MNIPNSITILRLILIPVFVGVFFSQISSHLVYSSLIFIFAGLTDVLDGTIARKYHLITKWGQVMDPLADKLMQLAVLLCLTIDGIIPLWIIIIIGAKELTMIFGGLFLYTRKGKLVIPANRVGKVATVFFYIAVLSITFDYPYWIYVFSFTILISLVALGQYMWISSRKLNKKNLETTR